MPSRETESYYEVLHQTQIKAYVSLPESCNGLNRNMGMDDPVSYTMDTGLFPGDKAAETQSWWLASIKYEAKNRKLKLDSPIQLQDLVLN